MENRLATIIVYNSQTVIVETYLFRSGGKKFLMDRMVSLTKKIEPGVVETTLRNTLLSDREFKLKKDMRLIYHIKLCINKISSLSL